MITIHLPIMMASFALAATWGLSLTVSKPFLRWGQILLTLGVVGMAFVQHRGRVLTYTRDPLGRQIVAAVAALDEKEPTVVEVWGPRYYALAYGKWVSKELAHIRLLDGRDRLAVLSSLPSLPPVFYTTEAMLYLYGPDVWAERLGGPVALESAGDGIVAIRQSPRLASDDTSLESTAQRVEVALDCATAWIAQEGDVRLTLVWRALRRPSVDYNVFVHVHGLPPAGGEEQLLAQGDRRHPVYGFYPTSWWVPGEQVRDDYRIPIPKGSQPMMIQLGLYLVKPEGGFENVAVWSVPISQRAASNQ